MDTFLIENNADNNAEGHTHNSSGTTEINPGSVSPRRALYQFDLSAIAAGSTINSVTFTLGVVKTPSSGSVDSAFGLHRALTSWGEGTQIGNNGAAAQAGDATWNSAQHGTLAWGGCGCNVRRRLHSHRFG